VAYDLAGTDLDVGTFRLDNPGTSNYYHTAIRLVTAQVNGECESDFVIVPTSGTQTLPPEITSTNLISTSTSVSGTHTVTGTTIYVYLNDETNQIGTTTWNGGTWNISIDSETLSYGDLVFARAKNGTNALSQLSNIVVVGDEEVGEPEESSVPVITGSYV